MRPAALYLLPLLAGCRMAADEALPSPWLRDTAAIDGTFRRDLLRHEFEAQVLAVDPVTAQLLRAAVATHTAQRRVSLENIANVNTIGFKRRVVCLSTESIQSADGERFTVPVVARITPQFTPGVLKVTERNLDVAIDGEGFFAVQVGDGSTRYTRNGSFHLDRDGKIVTGDGHVVLPEITLPDDLLEICFDKEGRVTGRTAGNADTTSQIGQLCIHKFVNPEGLAILGACLFQATDAAGTVATGNAGSNGLGTLMQGFLERSNVQVNSELVNLQVYERQHQTLTQVMRQFGMIAP